MIQLPLFPTETNWSPPTSLPDLSREKIIGIDTENKDPLLTTKGPSFIHGQGSLTGVGVAVPGRKWYFPLRHPGGGNLDIGVVSRWLNDTLKVDRDYVFTQAPYDVGWLSTIGVEVGGRWRDISIAATLLDEEHPAGFGLDAIGKRFAGRGKNEAGLREAAANWEVDAKKDMWQLPANLVGPYAEEDPALTLDSWNAMMPLIKAEGLESTLELETQVSPVLYRMWRKGVRVDLNFADELNARWKKQEDALLKGLKMHREEIWESKVIVRFCDERGIKYPYTAPTDKFPRGQPSITAGFMEHHAHPDMAPLRLVRAINRTRSVYLEESVLNGHIKGRTHPQYIQLASDEGGTRTGRLSARNPNIQQVPKRSGLFDAATLRKVYLPEVGERWAKCDYSSQEPRLQCHYGLLFKFPGAPEVKEQFAKGVKLYAYIEKATKGKCSYDQSKEITLGRSYGMGIAKMSDRLGLDPDLCAEILADFDAVVPYIRMLAETCSNLAQQRGFIRTLLNRRRHFNFRRPIGNNSDTPLHGDAAALRWPDKVLERVGAYKALNALIQGSAADQTKKALVDIDRAFGTPLMTVHDEISLSVKTEAEALKMKSLMESAVELLLPAKADLDLKPHWC